MQLKYRLLRKLLHNWMLITPSTIQIQYNLRQLTFQTLLIWIVRINISIFSIKNNFNFQNLSQLLIFNYKLQQDETKARRKDCHFPDTRYISLFPYQALPAAK